MATKWTMNSSSLQKGMLIRRPGLDEALEVVNVRDGQAKIKLPGGKTSTIPASAEVEWSWPEMDASKALASNTREKFLEKNPEIAKDPQTELDLDSASAWQTDWNFLDVGSKIEVLGEPGDFTILRLTDSTARIKHNTTAQIQSLSIGHKFKVVNSAKESKPAKSTKPKGGKKSTKPATKPLLQETEDDETESTLELEIEAASDNGPSDEDLTAIENGDDPDPEPSDDELILVRSDSDRDRDNGDFDENDFDEDDFPPDPRHPKDVKDFASNPSKPQARKESALPKNNNTTNSSSLLTLGQISERTGISYPTLVRYVHDHSDRLPSEGEGRSRRYYPDAIDIFREIRSETKGGRKPGSGNKPKASSSGATSRKPKAGKPAATADNLHTAPTRTQAKAPGITQPQSAPSSFAQTIDSKLGEAIDHAQAQISVLEALVENLETQRESLKLWS